MSSSKKDAIGYLDGVPFKIAEQCFVMHTVKVPKFEDLTPPSVLTEQYSFDLERRVLEEVKDFERKKEERKAKAIAPPAAALPATAGSQGEQTSNVNGLQQAQGVPAPKQQLPWNTTTILQPLPSQPATYTSVPSTSTANSHKFNLSDFENDTSSPFDMMEMKSINDLEELNTVFRDLSAGVPASSTGNNSITTTATTTTPLAENRGAAVSSTVPPLLTSSLAVPFDYASASSTYYSHSSKFHPYFTHPGPSPPTHTSTFPSKPTSSINYYNPITFHNTNFYPTLDDPDSVPAASPPFTAGAPPPLSTYSTQSATFPPSVPLRSSRSVHDLRTVLPAAPTSAEIRRTPSSHNLSSDSPS